METGLFNAWSVVTSITVSMFKWSGLSIKIHQAWAIPSNSNELPWWASPDSMGGVTTRHVKKCIFGGGLSICTYHNYFALDWAMQCEVKIIDPSKVFFWLKKNGKKTSESLPLKKLINNISAMADSSEGWDNPSGTNLAESWSWNCKVSPYASKHLWTNGVLSTYFCFNQFSHCSPVFQPLKREVLNEQFPADQWSALLGSSCFSNTILQTGGKQASAWTDNHQYLFQWG